MLFFSEAPIGNKDQKPSDETQDFPHFSKEFWIIAKKQAL